MKITLYLTVFVLLFISTFCKGQPAKPFPQNINYLYGIKPKTLTFEEARSTYNIWKEKFLVACNGGYRVACDGGEETRVEAIGFGTILTAYFGDKMEFDGLIKFYESKRTINANNMMAWSVSCDSIYDPGSATDGDIDVAFALLVAYSQWGGDYLGKASRIIDTLKKSVVITCDSLFVLAPGYSVKSDENPRWGGCDLTDIQYYTPAFFRLFARVTNDKDWDKLADDSYTILNAAAHPETGLVPDWQSVDGKPGGNSYRATHYAYDACRVPWRLSLDYLWNGNEQAKEWCTKVSNWAGNTGASNIRDGYNLDGTEKNYGYHNSAFVGGFAVSAMCNSQEVLDAFGTELTSDQMQDNHWFSMCTRSLYLLTLTGNFWKPDLQFE